MMPILDGFGVLKILNKNPRLNHIPLIFLTAKAEKGDFRKGMNLGAEDYITKPFNSEELLLRVQAILKRSSSEVDEKEDIKEFEIGNYHFNYPLRILTRKDEEGENLS